MSQVPRLALALTLVCTVRAQAEPQLLYRSITLEAAQEYQAGAGAFGPGSLRLIGRAEVALTPDLSAKAVLAPCVGPDSDTPEGVTQCHRTRWIEELTLRGFFGDLDFSLGRQVVTLGNTEGFILLDRFNGQDLCRFARVDVQNKLPNWIAQGRAYLDRSTFSVTLAPYSAESLIPSGYCADEFNRPQRFAGLDDPGNDGLDDWAGGLEWALTEDRWSAALNLISTREDRFVLETVPIPRKTRPRTLWIGGTASTTLGGVVLRGELAYAPERAFTLDPDTTLDLLQQGRRTHGVDERGQLLASLGLELRSGNAYWALQYFHDQIENGPSLVRARSAHLASLRLRRTFANERLVLDAFAVADLDYHDLALRASLTYDLDDQTRLALGSTVYADGGEDTGPFGSYVGRESLFAQVSRGF